MAKTKILIVDDNADTRLVLSARLRSNNYDVALAADTYQAVSVARAANPNLILLDIGLPGGNGFIVLERLKALATLSSTPVIIMSSEERQDVEVKAIEAGAEAFLQKPIDHTELLATIRSVLGESAESSQKSL
jgi:DNA-binding response OmpR family regulator